MYQTLAVVLILTKAVTDCVISLKNGEVQNALIQGWVHVFLLYLLWGGGFFG
jgi:hypothetical protein